MSLRLALTLPLTLAIAAATLAGCGKMGQLERPGPMFGGGGGDAPPSTSSSGENVRTIDPRDQRGGLSPLPPRTAPIENTRDPAAAGPPGALPDPYNNPQ